MKIWYKTSEGSWSKLRGFWTLLKKGAPTSIVRKERVRTGCVIRRLGSDEEVGLLKGSCDFPLQANSHRGVIYLQSFLHSLSPFPPHTADHHLSSSAECGAFFHMWSLLCWHTLFFEFVLILCTVLGWTVGFLHWRDIKKSNFDRDPRNSHRWPNCACFFFTFLPHFSAQRALRAFRNFFCQWI